MKRKEILETAYGCVCGQRQTDYGKPEDNFTAIGRLWEAYKGIPFTPVDVAVMMGLLKIGRIQSGTATLDSFIDLAGYAACGGELVSEMKSEGKQNE